jgi:hypothetical protein
LNQVMINGWYWNITCYNNKGMLSLNKKTNEVCSYTYWAISEAMFYSGKQSKWETVFRKYLWFYCVSVNKSAAYLMKSVSFSYWYYKKECKHKLQNFRLHFINVCVAVCVSFLALYHTAEKGRLNMETFSGNCYNDKTVKKLLLTFSKITSHSVRKHLENPIFL